MQIDAELPGQGETTAREVEPDHVQMIRRLIVQFGNYAEGLFDYHDFGFSREVVRHHITKVEAEIGRVFERGSEAFLEIPGEVLQAEIRDVWNSKKNLRYAAGALMMSSLRNDVRVENRPRAIRLKSVYDVTEGSDPRRGRLPDRRLPHGCTRSGPGAVGVDLGLDFAHRSPQPPRPVLRGRPPLFEGARGTPCRVVLLRCRRHADEQRDGPAERPRGRHREHLPDRARRPGGSRIADGPWVSTRADDARL